MTETREAKQLMHAALNVVAPVDRFLELRGYIRGYKDGMAAAEARFQIVKKESQEHSADTMAM